MLSLNDIIKGKGFFGAIGQIGGLTLISRVLGFIRDVLIAIFVGAGPIADAFFVAFKLPNLFRGMTAEGALTNTFTPAYVQATKKSDKAAAEFAAETQAVLLWVLIIATGVMEIIMPTIITLLAPGFETGDERHTTAIELARITMPFLPMISLVTLWAAIGNVNDRFWGGALLPIVLNVFLIAGAVISGVVAGVGALPLAVAVPISGFFQILLMQRMLTKIGKQPRWMLWPKLSNAGRRMWRACGVAAIGEGGLQISIIFDTVLASLLPVGAISALYYADRVAQLPLGIIGVSIGTALLPRLSRFEANKRPDAVAETIARASYFGLFFSIPSMAAIIVLADKIIKGLFAYGAFDLARVETIAWVLVAYGVGVPAFILFKVIQPAFFAANDPRTPMLIAFLTIFVNVILSLILMLVMGITGIALATSLSIWLSVIIMLIILARKGRIDKRMLGGVLPIIGASFFMVLLLLAAEALFGYYLVSTGAISRIFELICLVLVGVVGYLGVVHWFDLWPRDTENKGA